MKPVICFGEALIDCLHTDTQEIDALAIPIFSHFPGGAPANVAVAIAKLKGNSFFAGTIGNDMFGKQLEEAFARYKVNCSHLQKSDDKNTALAFVHLDNNGERSFTFLRHDTADLYYNTQGMNWDIHQQAGLFHVCSNTLCESPIYQCTLALCETAKEKQWLSSFDINYRSNLWPDTQAAPLRINTILKKMDIIKASQEDINEIWPGRKLNDFIEQWRNINRVIYITNNDQPIQVIQGNKITELAVPKTEVLDTTGAGDSFIAGVLYYLSQQADLHTLNSDHYIEAAKLGLLCGSITVSRKGAYPSLPYHSEINHIEKS